MASSIQPNLAASSTRHCSRVTVRYQGIVDAALVVAAIDEFMRSTYYDRRV